jgi:hypothetical protein
VDEQSEPRGGALGKYLALQADVRELREQFTGLEGQVGEVAGLIEGLAEDRKQSKPAPAWWPAERAERWSEFLCWLRDVLAARYPADARRLTPCWADHPATVDALTALWLTWQAAYLNRAADARDAAQWQATWRRDLIEVAVGSLNECRGAGEHRELVALPARLLESFAS